MHHPDPVNLKFSQVEDLRQDRLFPSVPLFQDPPTPSVPASEEELEAAVHQDAPVDKVPQGGLDESVVQVDGHCQVWPCWGHVAKACI